MMAGRALHLPEGVRLAKLTIVPDDLLARAWALGSASRLQAFLSSMAEHRKPLVSQCTELVIKGFEVTPELLRTAGALCPALQTLVLQYCLLCFGSFAAIASALPHLDHLACRNSSIEQFGWLSDAESTDEDCDSMVDITEDLPHLGSMRLQSLELTQTVGAPMAWEDLAWFDLSFLKQQPLASHLTRLVTHTTHLLEDGDEAEDVNECLKSDLEHIAHLTNLQSLTLAAHWDMIQLDCFAPLLGLTNLKELDLTEECVLKSSDHVLGPSLTQLTQVTKLSLGSVNITPNVCHWTWPTHWQEVHLLGDNCVGNMNNRLGSAAGNTHVYGQRLGLYDSAGPGGDGDPDFSFWAYARALAEGIQRTHTFHLGPNTMLKLRCNVPDNQEPPRYLRFKASGRVWEVLAPLRAQLQALELSDFDLSKSDVEQLGTCFGGQLRTLRLVNCMASLEALLALLPKQTQQARYIQQLAAQQQHHTNLMQQLQQLQSIGQANSASAASVMQAIIQQMQQAQHQLVNQANAGHEVQSRQAAGSWQALMSRGFTALQRLDVVWCTGPHDQWLPALEQLCSLWPTGQRELHVHLAVPVHMLPAARQMAARAMAPRAPAAAEHLQQQRQAYQQLAAQQQQLYTNLMQQLQHLQSCGQGNSASALSVIQAMQQLQQAQRQLMMQAAQAARYQQQHQQQGKAGGNSWHAGLQAGTGTAASPTTPAALSLSLQDVRTVAVASTRRRRTVKAKRTAALDDGDGDDAEPDSRLPSPITVSVTTWGEEQGRREVDRWQGAEHHTYQGYAGPSWADIVAAAAWEEEYGYGYGYSGSDDEECGRCSCCGGYH